MMLALLEAFPAGEPVVVLLDNLESVMDTERETPAEPALREALSAVLTGPAHAITMIATTRVTPTALLGVEPARQRQLRLTEGLDPPDARIVLRELDDDGRLGLRNAPDDFLEGLCRHTRGNPRALEAVKAILEGDETLTPRDLLDRARQLPGDQVVQVLVGEAYELLDSPAQRVMQGLSVFPAPVSAVGVDFLLRPVDPTTDAAPILTRLVRRQMVPSPRSRWPASRLAPPTTMPRSEHRDSPGAPWKTSGLSWPSSDCAATRGTTTPPPPCCKVSTTTICKRGVTTAPWSICTDASASESQIPPGRGPARAGDEYRRHHRRHPARGRSPIRAGAGPPSPR